jgi:hypothetical protein
VCSTAALVGSPQGAERYFSVSECAAGRSNGDVERGVTPGPGCCSGTESWTPWAAADLRASVSAPSNGAVRW